MGLYNRYFKILLLVIFMVTVVGEAGAENNRRVVLNDRYFTDYESSYIENITVQEDEKAKDTQVSKEDVKVDSAAKENIFYADEWIRSWFVRIDKNGDKKINQNEFLENMDLFDVTENHLSIFKQENGNHDESLSLFEFNNFVDTTNFLKKEQVASKATPVTGTSDDIDPLKFLGGIICISLLIAAFKFV